MTRFADLHLRVPVKDAAKSRRMIEKSRELGYHLVAIPFPSSFSRDRVERLRRICGDAGVDLATRVDLNPENPRELLHSLRRLRRRVEVISVLCTSKAVARQAAKDRRVDLLSFPTVARHKRFFDSAEAELASVSTSSLEIDIAQLLSLEGSSRMQHLSILRREVSTASDFGVSVTVSSGATNEYMLRRPRDYAALTMLFDMDLPLALKALSENPLTIVERNRRKLDPNFVAPGIRIAKRMNP